MHNVWGEEAHKIHICGVQYLREVGAKHWPCLAGSNLPVYRIDAGSMHSQQDGAWARLWYGELCCMKNLRATIGFVLDSFHTACCDVFLKLGGCIGSETECSRAQRLTPCRIFRLELNENYATCEYITMRAAGSLLAFGR